METSLASQWLRLCALNTRGMGSIPDQETKILPAVQCSQKFFLINRLKKAILTYPFTLNAIWRRNGNAN